MTPSSEHFGLIDMNKSTMMIVAVAVVAIVVVAAVAVMFTGGDDEPEINEMETAKNLQIRGNANDDLTIDSKDMEIMNMILDGKASKKDYPLADVNNDNEVDEEDKKLLQNLIDRKEGSTVYVLCLDKYGENTTVECTYPLRDVVPYGTNMQTPTLYANGGQYVAGYFKSSYEVADASMSSSAVDLKGNQREISDAAWKNFTTLSAGLTNGVGAFLADYSGISQITDARQADLNAAKIPLIVYPSADAEDEINTVLTLGFLFGGDCEKVGYDYADKSKKIIEEIDAKVGNLSDSERSSYICFTMHYYICQNDSTFNTSAATAGGIPYYKLNAEFAEKYKGDSSTKMTSTEALSNYTDVDTLINNRSMDWGLTEDEWKALVIDTWAHDNKGIPTYEFFKGMEDRLYFVNNLLPGAVKVAYMAHALYGEQFSLDWADGKLQEFIDMGTAPLKGQTLDSILSFMDQDTYEACLA